MASPISTLSREIHECTQCSRLRKHCLSIAQVNRRAYADETYWGKPVSGFGDPKAQVIIVGLAPAAHGANRTGRIFTGDRSGEWLYRALHRAGFANQPTSTHLRDGLKLKNAYVSCVVRCAPPDNKPTPREIERCTPYLAREILAIKDLRVFIALGNIALQGLWKHLERLSEFEGKKPKFAHGAVVKISPRHHLLLSYHPSQQNTFTGRLTEPMFDRVFEKARSLII